MNILKKIISNFIDKMYYVHVFIFITLGLLFAGLFNQDYFQVAGFCLFGTSLIMFVHIFMLRGNSKCQKEMR